MSLATFTEDRGTLWLEQERQLDDVQKLWPWTWRLRIRAFVGHRPFIWFVDDEAMNRTWFVKNHREHFGVLTFSSRAHFVNALRSKTPCDAVVTDIFFPANQPTTEEQARELLSIYERIDSCTVANLPKLWVEVRKLWRLDGFDVARDVTDYAKHRKEQIPVLLFSRKATLLLNREDWLRDPPAAVENTFWLLEKIAPTVEGEAARDVAALQRERIMAALRYRHKATPWWKKAAAWVMKAVGWAFKIAGFVKGLSPL